MNQTILAQLTLLMLLARCLDAQSQIRVRPHVPEIRIESVEPAVVSPGGKVDILGYGFGASQGGRLVIILSDGTEHRQGVLAAGFWSQRRIGVKIPENIRPGEYRIGICTDNTLSVDRESIRTCRSHTNTIPIVIEAPRQR